MADPNLAPMDTDPPAQHQQQTMQYAGDKPIAAIAKPRKFNDLGEYTPFYGVTNIAMAPAQPFLHKIHAFLTSSRFIKQRFAPLPEESYHMTVMNLKTKPDGSLQWAEYLRTQRANFCTPLLAAFTASIPAFKVVVRSIEEHGVLLMRVEIVDKDVAAKVNAFRTEAMRMHGIDDRNLAFHVTLGYGFRPLKDSDRDAFAEELTTLKTMVVGQIIELQAPDVHYYVDMTNFKSLTHAQLA